MKTNTTDSCYVAVELSTHSCYVAVELSTHSCYVAVEISTHSCYVAVEMSTHSCYVAVELSTHSCYVAVEMSTHSCYVAVELSTKFTPLTVNVLTIRMIYHHMARHHTSQIVPRFLLSLQCSSNDRPYVIQRRDVPCIQDYKRAYVTISVTASCFVYNTRVWCAVTCLCPNVALESVT
jgi:hypothetical protein